VIGKSSNTIDGGVLKHMPYALKLASELSAIEIASTKTIASMGEEAYKN